MSRICLANVSKAPTETGKGCVYGRELTTHDQFIKRLVLKPNVNKNWEACQYLQRLRLLMQDKYSQPLMITLIQQRDHKCVWKTSLLSEVKTSHPSDKVLIQDRPCVCLGCALVTYGGEMVEMFILKTLFSLHHDCLVLITAGWQNNKLQSKNTKVPYKLDNDNISCFSFQGSSSF